MRFHADPEWECPRCRLVATQVAGRRGRCTHCDAELVAAHSPSEELIRAYLYGDEPDHSHLRRPVGAVR